MALANLLYRVSVIANEASSLEEAVRACLKVVGAYTGWPVGHYYIRVQGLPKRLTPTKIWHLDDPKRFASFQKKTMETEFSVGVGLPGHVLASEKFAWINNTAKAPNAPNGGASNDFVPRTGFGLPVKVNGKLAAVLAFYTSEDVKPDQSLIPILGYMGIQLGWVAERGRAKRELSESRRKYRALVETIPHGVYEADISGNIVFANSGMLKMFGYSAREIKRIKSSELFTGNDHISAMAGTTNIPKPFPYAIKGVAKDGGVLDAIVNWNYKRNEQGKVTGFISTITDATEHKRAKKQLAENEFGRIKAFGALNHIPMGIALVGKNNQVTFINKAASKIVRDNDGLFFRDNIISLNRQEENTALREIINTFILNVRGDIPPNRTMAVSKRSGGRPYSVLISAFIGERGPFTEKPLVALFITDMENQVGVPAAFLQSLFGLSPAEGRLLENLVDNRSLEETADLMGITINTARKYLKTVFDKTSTNRQSQLVRLVMATPAWIGGQVKGGAS